MVLPGDGAGGSSGVRQPLTFARASSFVYVIELVNTQANINHGRDRSSPSGSPKTVREPGASRPASSKLVQLPGADQARVLGKTEFTRMPIHTGGSDGVCPSLCWD